MKKKDIPQDESALADISREICYAQNDSGEYETGLSKGWEVKKAALDLAWDDVHARIDAAKKQVLNGEISPIFYYMELKLMDVQILAGYTGFFKWTVKRHFKPNVFAKLSDTKLEIYANIFDITLAELKQIQ
jgi:hypothetical protein